MSTVRGLIRIASTPPFTSDIGHWTSDRRRTPARSDGFSAPDLAGDRMHDHAAKFLSGFSCGASVSVPLIPRTLGISLSLTRTAFSLYEASFLIRTDIILGLACPFRVRERRRLLEGISVIPPTP